MAPMIFSLPALRVLRSVLPACSMACIDGEETLSPVVQVFVNELKAVIANSMQKRSREV
jgi:hypothetical protein